MSDRLLHIGDGFWNVRGTYKIGGVFDVGTQTSLVRLSSGAFVLLDCYTLTGEVLDEVMALTDDGRSVEAILNLHPFHTLHVEACASRFPRARLYGTARHGLRTPLLRWETVHTDDPALHERYLADLQFSVPRGVQFIPDNERVHFSSVLVLHHASKTLHVDDTLTWINLPLMRGLHFHPSLPAALARRAGAAVEFRAWARELAEQCQGVEHVCTAHTKPLPPPSPHRRTVTDWVLRALARREAALTRHQQRFG